jgi:hexosaminidase
MIHKMTVIVVSSLIALCLIASCCASDRASVPEPARDETVWLRPAIIPRPLDLIVHEDQQRYLVSTDTVIHSCKDFLSEAHYLAEFLLASTGLDLEVREGTSDTGICFSLADDQELGKEGYRLEVSDTLIQIAATRSAGAFYAVQTLIQSLPVEVFEQKKQAGVTWDIPAMTVVDKPRFSWRCFMLDEARYFKGMKVVKSLLDQMAIHKMNVFHWHLTDDQGWRVEIKKYPRLTEVGSKRKDSQVGFWNSEKRSGQAHSGFYTQEQIKEIVAYAGERHITIVPEIEMPGHASAAAAAYPELSTQRVPVEVATVFGKHYVAFNPADENVYRILSDILDEIADLFPSEVIHIGGDEVRFDHWKQSDDVKQLMEREGFKTVADVQIYFTNRMSRIIEAKGRRMMGWNEILGDDLHGFLKGQTRDKASLSSNALVHFWKGNSDLATRAIRAGHDVVNSWHSYTYLDYTYKQIPLSKAYNFDPVFKGLEPQYHDKIKGFGCHMWGEWIPKVAHMEWQVYPRLSAYAEVGWTALDRKDYDDFKGRMTFQVRRWDILGIGYAKEAMEIGK